MTDTNLETLMAKLRWLLSKNDNFFKSIVNNHFIFIKEKSRWLNNKTIVNNRSEIQLLYQEFDYLIGSCFKGMTNHEEQQHDLEDAGNWKRRLTEAALKAEDTVDMFVSYAIIESNSDLYYGYGFYSSVENLLDSSLKNINGVMDDLYSIREELNNKKENYFRKHVKQDMMDKKINNKSIGTSSIGNTRVNLSTTKHQELVVGFDDDALLIIDRLTRDRKKLDVISIVGMGGLGKTTLATKIFNDALVEYHFDRRGWITVSQTYSKRDMLVQVLASIGKSVHEATCESKLYEMLYQSLKGKRYLIVIDDIWSRNAWDDVGICFPDDKTGSRVLVTTRLKEVAWHISRGGFTHNLGHLNQEQSWELLCKNTFRGYECPESLIDTGKRIAKKCGGLPLALVVIGGILEKEERIEFWEKIAESVGSYVINDPQGCLDTLALSYDHLPFHLKKCFMYIGGFPEDCKIQVGRLIRLWMAEGFIKESYQRSLEEEGEYCLMDLIDRNLLIVAEKKSNGRIKSCRVHDLLRELCLKKASEENFFNEMSVQMPDNNLSSVLCFFGNQLFGDQWSDHNITASWVRSFLLLRVLDLLSISVNNLSNLRVLVHLRYLAVRTDPDSKLSILDNRDFSLANINFWSLQTLIVKGKWKYFQSFIYLPDDMENLRHLRCDRIDIRIGFYVILSNLQTISRLVLDHRAEFLLHYFPNIKKLGCSISSTSINFSLLKHLEALDINLHLYESTTLASPIRFPETLKKLTLKGLCLPWNYMSTIQRLPKLEVLKLLESSFKGHKWETGDEQFQQLKYLKLEKLNIRVWEASRINFPRLTKLVVRNCVNLEEIPLELGNIYTLEHIEISSSNSRVLESVSKIQKAQREMENEDFHVNFTDMDPSEVFFRGDPFYY